MRRGPTNRPARAACVGRVAVALVIMVFGATTLAACDDTGEPFDAPTTPSTAPSTDPAVLLAQQRADAAEALVDGLLACPTVRPDAVTERSFAVAYVTSSRESRRGAGPARLPDVGKDIAQIRALVDAANTCPGPAIELHVHDQYEVGVEVSLAQVCDDVARNERNDLVIARDIPIAAMRCVTDRIPTIFIGTAPQTSRPPGILTLIGPDADAAIATTMATVREMSIIAEDASVGLLTDAEDTDYVKSVVAPLVQPAVAAALSYEDDAGCPEARAAARDFRAKNVDVIVSGLSFRCLPEAANELRHLRAQWLILPIGVGTDDEALAALNASAIGLDGALAVTPLPRGPIALTTPAAPPALGEACNRITAAKGEDYEYGIIEYQSIEELCLAVALARNAARGPREADAIVDAVRAEAELPLPNNLLGGFPDGRAWATDEVVYVQRYAADCGCWQYESGPIARDRG
jgi:hypothetical protein